MEFRVPLQPHHEGRALVADRLDHAVRIGDGFDRDVAPDGTAWIVGDTIFRARYRNGYDKPAPLNSGEVATIHPTPIATAIQFGVGHRIRVEVTSSNFPKFVRNLNTGGPNESEKEGVVADNAVHHAADAASYIELPVLR